jgi:hypothetical protein
VHLLPKMDIWMSLHGVINMDVNGMQKLVYMLLKMGV